MDNIKEVKAFPENSEFSSEVVMDRKLHKEFYLLSYRKISIFVFIYTIFLLLSAIPNFFGTHNYELVLGNAVGFLVLTVVYFLGVNNKEKRLFAQKTFIENNNLSHSLVCFNEKIYSGMKGKEPKIFCYSSVKKIFETKNLYILLLEYDVCVVVDRNTLAGIKGIDFRQYILSRCYYLKKRKIYKLEKLKILLIISILIQSIIFIAALILNFIR